jgi:hypothetical protein
MANVSTPSRISRLGTNSPGSSGKGNFPAAYWIAISHELATANQTWLATSEVTPSYLRGSSEVPPRYL